MTIRKKINLALLRLVQNEVPSRQRWDTFRYSGWDQVKNSHTFKVSQDQISDLTFQQTHPPSPWSPWLRKPTTSIFLHGYWRLKLKMRQLGPFLPFLAIDQKQEPKRERGEKVTCYRGSLQMSKKRSCLVKGVLHLPPHVGPVLYSDKFTVVIHTTRISMPSEC